MAVVVVVVDTAAVAATAVAVSGPARPTCSALHNQPRQPVRLMTGWPEVLVISTAGVEWCGQHQRERTGHKKTRNTGARKDTKHECTSAFV